MVIVPFNLRRFSLLAWISRPKLRSSEPWCWNVGFYSFLVSSLTSGIPNGCWNAGKNFQRAMEDYGRNCHIAWQRNSWAKAPWRNVWKVLLGVGERGSEMCFCREDHFGVSRKWWINAFYIPRESNSMSYSCMFTTNRSKHHHITKCRKQMWK